jgi:hypothetical protein
LLHCRASIRQGSCWTTLDIEESLFGSVELLWTLNSHSLGQSEDQADRSSYLHPNFLISILGGSSSYGCFLMIPFYFILVTFHVSRISSFEIPFYSWGYHSVLVIFHVISFYLSVPSFLVDVRLPFWVFFHRKLEIHPYRFPMLWQHLPTIRGIIGYPPKV